MVIYIVNNYPMTKNKQVYHVEDKLTDEMVSFYELCSERDKPVYFWSLGCYLLYNATTVEENQQKQTSFTSK